MVLAEAEDVIVDESEIGRDDEGDPLTRGGGHPLGFPDDELDQSEIEQRLAALKLDLDVFSRALHQALERQDRRLAAHIERRPVIALPGHLTIGAGMLTPQGDYKDGEPENMSQMREAPLR